MKRVVARLAVGRLHGGNGRAAEGAPMFAFAAGFPTADLADQPPKIQARPAAAPAVGQRSSRDLFGFHSSRTSERLLTGGGFSMEHRWGERIQLDIPAQLSDGASSVSQVRISELSFSGAFLTTRQHLAPQAYVDVAFSLRRTGRSKPHRVAAYVVRRTRKRDCPRMV